MPRRRTKDARQADLFLVKPNVSALERKIKAVPISQLSQVNLFPDYAVTFDGMRHFRSTPQPIQRNLSDNYYFLQSAFYGLHNMESFDGRFGIPHDMLVEMHPAEILANYYAAYLTKLNDVLHGYGAFKDLESKVKKPSNVSEVNDFVVSAFNYALERVHGLREFYHRHNPKIHETPLRDRLDKVPDTAKLKFLKSLGLPHRRIDLITPHFAYAGRYPNPEDIADYNGIDAYRGRIAAFIHEVYAQNTKPATKTS